jgi:Cof subfamily protein (haloacid dehalogenase superfamily)
MIRLAAFDLDGTLMGDEREIHPRVQRAIAEAQARGVTTTLATGRMFSALLPFARQLNISAPVLAYQGGWIQRPDDPEPLYRVALPRKPAEITLTLARESDWHTVLYADGRIYLQELRESPEFYRTLLGSDFQRVDDWHEVLDTHEIDKVLFVADPTEIPAMGQRLRARLNEQAHVFRSHARFIEVVPAGVDKGQGLAWLADHLGIAQAETMAVGDQENDVAMVAWAGVGVAMGNAVPPVQAVADWIAPPLSEHGAAVALERFALR